MLEFINVAEVSLTCSTCLIDTRLFGYCMLKQFHTTFLNLRVLGPHKLKVNVII